MSIRDHNALKQAKQSLLEQSNNYTYSENSNVLKNKLNIQNSQVFKMKCAHMVAKEFVNVHQEPTPKKIDHSYLKQLHKQLFGKIFDWAGETRDTAVKMSDGTTANVSTNEQVLPFASDEGVKLCLTELNEKLAKRNEDISKEQEKQKKFSEDISTIYALLSHAHAFLDGNEITQRLFVEKLSQSENRKIDFSVVTQKRMQDAVVNAANDNLGPMKHLFEDASNPEKVQDLKAAINEIKSNDEEKSLAERIVTTPIPGKSYTGVFENRKLDTIVIRTADSLVVCNRHVIPRDKLRNAKIGDKITFKALDDINQVFIPGRELPNLTDYQIMENTVTSPSVREQRREVERLTRLVFGNREKLTNQLERICENPNLAQQLSVSIAHDPKSVSKLAGFKKLGLKSPKRKEAEKNVIPLSEAVRKFADCLKSAREEVLQAHREEQYRTGQAVENPTEKVKHFLSMSQEERENALKTEGNITIYKELHNFLSKVSLRLSANENKMIKNNDFSLLAKSIDIPDNKAKEIIETVKEAQNMKNQIKLTKPPRTKAMALA
ncbi:MULTISPECIES: BID domain-containing T4SS effector [unclassified Bartonella]|uniref:BID domain-containing T4SS effector n=1 Tax=unclassified Bartonella TaxID=2645622 RepID=UPI000999CC63|nr:MULTISPECIES: BID domain-containing T4SS effector [unclassified Bartonella]AQX28283.1 Bartonella effector protein Bep10/1 [Bartonella sp. JB15]AQX29554.1 Bartonella effector protein Bep10/1 [Bartonella sp. JB63]